jgi:hypothetical protein
MPYSLSDLNRLSNEKIDAVVTRTAPGVYALDPTERGAFVVKYVGRSDDDLNKRLKDWVGTKYVYFKFDYATSPKNAFEKECELYHDNGGPEGKLDNEIHPRRPDGTDWKCPRCKTYG